MRVVVNIIICIGIREYYHYLRSTFYAFLGKPQIYEVHIPKNFPYTKCSTQSISWLEHLVDHKLLGIGGLYGDYLLL